MIAGNHVSQIVPLSCLGKNEKARIVDLVGECGCLHRLEEMGVRIGSEISMLVQGKPCIVLLDGRRLSLRFDCEAEILVEPMLG